MRTDFKIASDELQASCKNCHHSLTDDEVALFKRLFNRGAMEFLCINCSAQYLGVSKSLLEEKLDFFKKSGCTLFKENQNR